MHLNQTECLITEKFSYFRSTLGVIRPPYTDDLNKSAPNDLSTEKSAYNASISSDLSSNDPDNMNSVSDHLANNDQTKYNPELW